MEFMMIRGASVGGNTGSLCRFDQAAQPERYVAIAKLHMIRLTIHHIAQSS
jgi:hypothetical protein